MFFNIPRLNRFIHRQTRCFWCFRNKLKKFLSCGWIVILCRGICEQYQTSLRQERHGINRVVQVVFVHRTRLEARRVHVRAGWVRKIGIKLFELTCDGEFVIAEEEVEIGHENFNHKGHKEHKVFKTFVPFVSFMVNYFVMMRWTPFRTRVTSMICMLPKSASVVM